MGRNEFRLSDAAEYFSGRRFLNIPSGCAVKKTVYIAKNEETVAKMEAEIRKLTKYLSECENKDSYEYKKAEKRLAVCQRIKRDCLDGIERTKQQIERMKMYYQR